EKDPDPELPELASESGILAKLTDALRFTNGLTNVPLQTLPRIANCYVVTDRTLARDLAGQFPQCWFLTAEGVNYHGQAVSGGKKNGAGPLALKRELRELSQAEQVKQAELDLAQESVSELDRSIALLSTQLDSLRAQQQAQEKEVYALDHQSRKLDEESERFRTTLSNSRLELEALSRERTHLQNSLEHDRNSLDASERLRAGEDRALESARERLADLQAEVAKAAEEHATVRANLASLEERRLSLQGNQARLELLVRELAERQSQLACEAEQLTNGRTEFVASNALLEAKGAELRSSISRSELAEKNLADRESELRARLAAIDDQLKQLRIEAQQIHDRRSELQVSLARAESDLAHLEQTCQQELQITLQQLTEGVETVEDEETLQRIEADYAELLRKIEALGPVNPQALEEFEQAEQRQDFLNAQRQDLLDSIRDTEKAIHEIDGESRKRFTEAFQAINANFREMFQVLFGGGIGEMRLTDEENAAESGIDIVASPPGKKLQSVLLLSGGEKSLTAMALLMAIFQYTPSPFCILDEVDAPLDEPNIDRLTRLLKQMAHQTQFIVITHAKATMEAAQALYGVTMQEPGISKLVSVRFKPAAPSQKQIETKIEEDLQPVIA
ncbi:MAG: chromosome segregation protein SMC, partial [Acidobacteriaceae bacterium]|nr:chromosome segregation protein SMC [Acidobacteriaceae bacterium]